MEAQGEHVNATQKHPTHTENLTWDLLAVKKLFPYVQFLCCDNTVLDYGTKTIWLRLASYFCSPGSVATNTLEIVQMFC